jgi:hypothetical protein
MKKSYKAKGVHGGTGVVRFDSTTHLLPAEYDGESEAMAKVVPTVTFDPDCDCGECGIAFVADKRMAATLRSIASLIDTTPVDRHQHHVTNIRGLAN